MTIVFNLLCKAFIAILDILLLNFYIKISFSNLYSKQVKKLLLIYILCYIYLIKVFLLMIIKDYFLLRLLKIT